MPSFSWPTLPSIPSPPPNNREIAILGQYLFIILEFSLGFSFCVKGSLKEAK